MGYQALARIFHAAPRDHRIAAELGAVQREADEVGGEGATQTDLKTGTVAGIKKQLGLK